MKSIKELMSGGAMAVSRVYGAHNIAYSVKQSMKNARNLEARSKYMPHQGEREVARRQRQAKRNQERQYDRAKTRCVVIDGVQKAFPLGTLISRRGNIIAQTA